MTVRAAQLPGRDVGDADNEWDILATALNRWGVVHVAPGHPVRVGLPATASELFERLARAVAPRLQQAIVVMLLTHPHLAADAQAAIERLDGVLRDRAMRRYVAAVALQRMAKSRIGLSLGSQPLVPVAYLPALNLPPLDAEFGRVTLLALAAQEQERYGYDAWGTYRTLLDHFLNDILRRGWGAVEPCVNAPTKRG